MVVVVSTLTFGTSLHTLVSRPALYGWNWDSALSGGGGVGAIPAKQATSALDHDTDVAAWTGVYFSTLQLDGEPYLFWVEAQTRGLDRRCSPGT